MSTTIYLCVGGADQSIQAAVVPAGAGAPVMAVIERLAGPDWMVDETLSDAWAHRVICAPVFSAFWRSRPGERPPSIKLEIHNLAALP